MVRLKETFFNVSKKFVFGVSAKIAISQLYTNIDVLHECKYLYTSKGIPIIDTQHLPLLILTP